MLYWRQKRAQQGFRGQVREKAVSLTQGFWRLKAISIPATIGLCLSLIDDSELLLTLYAANPHGLP